MVMSEIHPSHQCACGSGLHESDCRCTTVERHFVVTLNEQTYEIVEMALQLIAEEDKRLELALHVFRVSTEEVKR